MDTKNDPIWRTARIVHESFFKGFYRKPLGHMLKELDTILTGKKTHLTSYPHKIISGTEQILWIFVNPNREISQESYGYKDFMDIVELLESNSYQQDLSSKLPKLNLESFNLPEDKYIQARANFLGIQAMQKELPFVFRFVNSLILFPVPSHEVAKVLPSTIYNKIKVGLKAWDSREDKSAFTPMTAEIFRDFIEVNEPLLNTLIDRHLFNMLWSKTR